MADEKRLQWIKQKACKGLAVDPELFDDLLEADGVARTIADFLDGGTLLTICALSMQNVLTV
eukprot:361875-Chlamydomonas_euryale.AAC.6